MIIDVHSHDFADAVVAHAMNGMCAVLEGNIYPAGDGTVQGHMESMARAGIDKAITCPIATKPSHFDVILRRACDIRDGVYGPEAQRRFIPFASVHPKDPDMRRHLQQIAAAGIKGVKFHSYYQNFALNDPSVREMFVQIADLGLVVQSHCGADVAYRNVFGFCGPKEIADLMKAVPHLKFIAAHLGGVVGYPVHATDQLLDSGCYIDTSVLNLVWHVDEAMRVLRSWPRERILFGTDHPWTHAPEAIAWVKRVRDPADWDLLFGENARRLLGI